MGHGTWRRHLGLLLACGGLAALLATPAEARERRGAGTSLGVGVTAYTPAPVVGLRVALPSLEIATAPGAGKVQLRLRTPLLETLYHALLRDQAMIAVDAILVAFPGSTEASGRPQLRFAVGPLLGLSLIAARHIVHPGVSLGARLGAELRGSGRRSGLWFGVEPRVTVQGGAAGVDRTTATFGGGALFVVALTGYASP